MFLLVAEVLFKEGSLWLFLCSREIPQQDKGMMFKKKKWRNVSMEVQRLQLVSTCPYWEAAVGRCA